MSELKDLTELCKKHRVAAEVIERNKEKIKEQQEQLSQIERQILDKLDEAEIKEYRLPDVGVFKKRTYVSWRVPSTPEDKQKYFTFLKEKGVYDAMITVNGNKHKSFCNSIMDEMAKKDPIAAADFTIPGVPGKSSVDKMGFSKK